MNLIHALSEAEIIGKLLEVERNAACPMLYGSPEFITFIAKATESELSCFYVKDGSIVHGVLPYLRKKITGQMAYVVNSLAWYGSHGGCILAKNCDTSTRKILLEGYLNYISK